MMKALEIFSSYSLGIWELQRTKLRLNYSPITCKQIALLMSGSKICQKTKRKTGVQLRQHFTSVGQ